MKAKHLALAACLASSLGLSNAAWSSSLVSEANQEFKTQQTHNKERIAGFKATEKELSQQKAQLLALKKKLQLESDKLANDFSSNEQTLAELEEELRLETGSLGELFGVVRQNAKEFQSDLRDSVTSVDKTQDRTVVDEIVAAETLPSMSQLTGFWNSMTSQIEASGAISQVKVPFVAGDGEKQTIDGHRLGAMGLVTEQGYINWDGSRLDAKAYPKLPDDSITATQVKAIEQGQLTTVLVDPSRGVMLQQYANTPTLGDRFNAGGVVGKVIVGLLAIGLLIGLYRGLVLSVTRQKIRSQLKKPNEPSNNPLGRILSVYKDDKSRSVEALELRLLEAVVDEQASLERGLSMLKLLAALAPMLGLLGTVIGMIETFQVITQFGNGDPKVMASGISMALVTTVLGLVAAMPLLLAHNLLSSQAETIRNLLEKQGIALVAEQAEKDQSPAHSTNDSSQDTPVGNAA